MAQQREDKLIECVLARLRVRLWQWRVTF